MKDVFYELIQEASTGKINIDGDEWPIFFDTIIEQDGKVILDTGNSAQNKLIIKDEKEFISLLKEYINLELKENRKTINFINKDIGEKQKFLIMNLLANATTEDLSNPTELLRKYINFLKDETFNFLNNGITIKLDESFFNSNLLIKKTQTDTRMETPNKIEFILKNTINKEEVEYHFPSIYYGIENVGGKRICYIYSIILDNKKENEKDNNKKFVSKINRKLYKINDKLKDIETKDYYLYKNKESEYYPEGNISDVSSSFVVVLNLFMTLLNTQNIENVKAIVYLPIRYSSRDLAASHAKSEEIKENLIERNNNIQTNLTNKFIRTFRRLAEQNKQIEIITYPYELDEFLTIKIHPRTKKLDNILLEETNKKIIEDEKLRK